MSDQETNPGGSGEAAAAESARAWQRCRRWRPIVDLMTAAAVKTGLYDNDEADRELTEARLVADEHPGRGLSRSFDEASPPRARRIVGLKGYVTNIPAAVMPAGEVIASYHDLWHVEQSFQMSKTDLAAGPMFARTRDARPTSPS